jgi:hypothetical protein
MTRLSDIEGDWGNIIISFLDTLESINKNLEKINGNLEYLSRYLEEQWRLHSTEDEKL